VLIYSFIQGVEMFCVQCSTLVCGQFAWKQEQKNSACVIYFIVMGMVYIVRCLVIFKKIFMT
jgi:hypothetical protein